MQIKKRLCRTVVTVLVLISLLVTSAVPALAVSVSSFGDVSGSAWYYDAVSFVTGKGLFQGTSSTTFSPNGAMTRGMFITVLGRYAGVNASAWRAGTVIGSGVNLRSGPGTSYDAVTVLNAGTSLTIDGKSGGWYKVTAGSYTGYVSGEYVSPSYHTFSDVGFGDYYAGYAIWAYERGVISGDGSADKFSPNKNITREQVCTILDRFAAAMGLGLTESAASTTFTDNGKISSWAKDSVYKMQRCSIVQGRENGAFVPAGSATRAEAAAILQRFSAATGGQTPSASNPGTGTGQGDTSSPAPTPAVPDAGSVADTPADITGAAVSLPARTIRVGLLVSTQQFNTCVTTVTLENTIGAGFEFGTMSGRSFASSGVSTASTTIKITTDGYNFTVTDAAGNVVHTAAAPMGIHPLGGKTVTRVNGEYKYNGDFELRQAAYVSGAITVINYVDVEDYVKGVIPYEFSTSWPVETLKAAAVVSRSHIMTANWGAYSQYGMDTVCNDGSQLYRGRGNGNYSEGSFATTDAAVDATANLYLTYNGQICTGFFFSSDGGATEDGSHIFGGSYGYLVGKLDPYEQAAKGQASNYTYSITNARTGSTMNALASSMGLGTIARNGIRVNTYPATGNVESVVITDESGRSATIGFGTSVDRWGFLQKFGFTAYSYRYSVTYDEASDSFTCTRLGWGHNVGMSQWGAYAMAQYYGKNYQQILGFYYTNTHLQYGA